MMLKSYYDKVKSHAVDVISAAVGMKVGNCWDGVHEALIEALRDGTYRTAAVVLRAVNMWDWANEESEEEEYKCSMGLRDCHAAQDQDKAETGHDAVVEAVEKATDKVVEAVESAAVKA